jgi:hypothetical protein
MIEDCIFCHIKLESIDRVSAGRDGYRLKCPVCGEYIASGTLIAATGNVREVQDDIYILSAVIRELNEMYSTVPELHSDNLKEYINYDLVPDLDSVESKARKLLQRLRKKSDHYGERIELFYNRDYPIAYAKNDDEFTALVEFLLDSDLLKEWSVTTAGYILSLTARAWDIMNSINPSGEDSKQGFIAIWFAKDGSMDSSIAALENAIKKSDYEPMCIRDVYFSDTIMDKALSEIRKSRFVVADLTGQRESVFVEIGFALGLNKDIIFVYKQGATLSEFYSKHYQCYEYKSPEELEEIVKNAIGARIK